MLETDTSANSFCKTFSITGLTAASGTPFALYPNPAQDYVEVSSGKDGLKKIELFDGRGALVFRAAYTTETFRIDSSELPAGLYVVKLKTGSEVAVQTLLKE